MSIYNCIMTNPITIDICCGMGCFSEGASRVGCKVVAGFDFDEKCIESWRANRRGYGVKIDICKESISDYLEQELGITEIDLIITGAPCQLLSCANRKQRCEGEDGKISSIAKQISEIEPKAFILENVPPLLRCNVEVYNKFVSQIPNSYETVGKVLLASDYGVPQHRKRSFVFGIRSDCLAIDEIKIPKPTHGEFGDKPHISAGEALDQLEVGVLPENFRVNPKYVEELNEIPAGMKYDYFTAKRGHPEPRYTWRSEYGDFLKVADPHEPCPTIKSTFGAGIGPYHWQKRRFTIKELKRLSTIPIDYTIPFSSTYEKQRQIGNTVPPKLAEVVIRTVIHQSTIDTCNPIPPLTSPTKPLKVDWRSRSCHKKLQQKAEKQYKQLYDLET